MCFENAVDRTAHALPSPPPRGGKVLGTREGMAGAWLVSCAGFFPGQIVCVSLVVRLVIVSLLFLSSFSSFLALCSSFPHVASLLIPLPSAPRAGAVSSFLPEHTRSALFQLACDVRSNTPKDRPFFARHARALAPRSAVGGVFALALGLHAFALSSAFLSVASCALVFSLWALAAGLTALALASTLFLGALAFGAALSALALFGAAGLASSAFVGLAGAQAALGALARALRAAKGTATEAGAKRSGRTEERAVDERALDEAIADQAQTQISLAVGDGADGDEPAYGEDDTLQSSQSAEQVQEDEQVEEQEEEDEEEKEAEEGATRKEAESPSCFSAAKQDGLVSASAPTCSSPPREAGRDVRADSSSEATGTCQASSFGAEPQHGEAIDAAPAPSPAPASPAPPASVDEESFRILKPAKGASSASALSPAPAQSSESSAQTHLRPLPPPTTPPRPLSAEVSPKPAASHTDVNEAETTAGSAHIRAVLVS